MHGPAGGDAVLVGQGHGLMDGDRLLDALDGLGLGGDDSDPVTDEAPGGVRYHDTVGPGQLLDAAREIRRVTHDRVARRPLAGPERTYDHETGVDSDPHL